jgi:indolepyruvate ferredoxin oxidoreductase
MVWPLEAATVRARFARGLDEILVVEEKRQLIEYQLKEELYNWSEDVRPRVIGKFDEKASGAAANGRCPPGNWLLPAHYELTPAMIARRSRSASASSALPTTLRPHQGAPRVPRRQGEGARQAARGRRAPTTSARAARTTPRPRARGQPRGGRHRLPLHGDLDARPQPETFTQMGGEGVPWIGQAPFTDEKHIFANLGDGTYFHSGLLAIRAAVAAGSTSPTRSSTTTRWR